MRNAIKWYFITVVILVATVSPIAIYATWGMPLDYVMWVNSHAVEGLTLLGAMAAWLAVSLFIGPHGHRRNGR